MASDLWPTPSSASTTFDEGLREQVTTFFTSDTHFGDHRVLNLYPRPFATLAEMDAGLIERWNRVCGPDDEIWHLGDFARTRLQAAAILPRLYGRKHLIIGNNDSAPAPAGWESVGPYAEIKRGGVLLVLCHYPFRSWNGQHRGSWNLHGHSHGRLKPLLRQYDVGVDLNDYMPVRLEELISKISRRREGAPDI
jgi:calcineurin-like phosphoesterase family protein